MGSLDFELSILLLPLALSVAMALRMGFRGGCAGTGLLLCCKRAWALTVKWFSLTACALILVVAVLEQLFLPDDSDILGVLISICAASLPFLLLFFVPLTCIPAMLVYNFGAQRRTREALAHPPAPHHPLSKTENTGA